MSFVSWSMKNMAAGRWLPVRHGRGLASQVRFHSAPSLSVPRPAGAVPAMAGGGDSRPRRRCSCPLSSQIVPPLSALSAPPHGGRL